MNLRENLFFLNRLHKPGALKPLMTLTRLPRGLKSLALGAKVNYSLPHRQCLTSNSSPGPPLFLNYSWSKPSVSKCSALAQWPWCYICSFKNLSPGFPFCFFVPLWAWEGILTQVLPLRHPAVFLSSVQTTSALWGHAYLRFPLPPVWNLSNLSCLPSSAMGTPEHCPLTLLRLSKLLLFLCRNMSFQPGLLPWLEI